jgi:phosphohistidine phosphatase
MKTLAILRHAHAKQAHLGEADFERVLRKRGVLAAQALGAQLATHPLRFQYALVSPATRCVETLAALESGYGTRIAQHQPRAPYLATADALMSAVQACDDAWGAVLLCAHNPGCHELALELAAASPPHIRAPLQHGFAPASYAQYQLDIAHWAELTPACARLVKFLPPAAKTD